MTPAEKFKLLQSTEALCLAIEKAARYFGAPSIERQATELADEIAIDWRLVVIREGKRHREGERHAKQARSPWSI